MTESIEVKCSACGALNRVGDRKGIPVCGRCGQDLPIVVDAEVRTEKPKASINWDRVRERIGIGFLVLLAIGSVVAFWPEVTRMGRVIASIFQSPPPTQVFLSGLSSPHVRGEIAPFSARCGPGKWLIKLVRTSAPQPPIEFHCANGETVQAHVPLGEYELRWATGSEWYGPEKLFGPATSASKATRRLVFYRTEDGVMGHDVVLEKRKDGNLSDISIQLSEF